MVKVTIGNGRSTTSSSGTEAGQTRFALPALAVLVALAPFNVAPPATDQRLQIALRPLMLLQLVICGAVVAAVARRGGPLGGARTPLLVGGLLVVMVGLSTALSDQRLIGLGGFVTAVALVTTVVATVLLLRSEPDIEHVIRWLVGGAAAGASIGLAVLINGGEPWFTEPFVGRVTRIDLTPRLTRPWSHANVAAMALGPAAAMLSVLIMSGRTLWHRLVDRGVLVVLVVSAVLTYSRAGVAAILIAVAVGAAVLWFRTDTGPGPTVREGAFLIGVMALVMAAAPGWERGVFIRTGDDFAATVVPPADVVLEPGGRIVSVTVTNHSDRTWQATGDDRVELSVRLLPDGDDRIADEQRWPLPDDVPPGVTETVTVPIAQTVADGRYRALWDLLIDQEAYFLQFAGSSSAAAGMLTVVDSPIDPGPTEPLVTPRVNLNRPELWRLAVDAFVDRPLLGVGPMQLGAFADDDLPDDRRFPGGHAHNLALEGLATWGLLGAVPLLVLLLGGGIGAWRSASRGENIGLVVLAGLTASGVHAAFEWQINEVSVALPLAVLVGIGWSLSAHRAGGRHSSMTHTAEQETVEQAGGGGT
ncbi:MAG: hypothetical protein AAF531_00220 [Actinomycetota bacterium]